MRGCCREWARLALNEASSQGGRSPWGPLPVGLVVAGWGEVRKGSSRITEITEWKIR